MVKYLRKYPNVRIILVEKTHRLYRNLKDWVTLDELDVENPPRQGRRGAVSRLALVGKCMHGIMAKNYIDNFSEEARKGQMEKAEQGIWPTTAPLGYVNTLAKDGKKVIEPHPVLAPVVTKLFERYATGQYSLKALAKAAHADGLIYPKSERQSGAGQHRSCDSAQPALHRATKAGRLCRLPPQICSGGGARRDIRSAARPTPLRRGGSGVGEDGAQGEPRR